MAQTAPGEIKAHAAAHRRRQQPNPSTPSSPISIASSCRASRTGSTRGSSATSRRTALLSSVLGDFVSTGLGVIGLAWQSSPALTEVEEVVDRLDAADARPVRRMERRDPGHGVDQHAGRAAVRA